MQHCNEHVRGEMRRLERKINNNIYIKCRRSLIVKLICECLSLSCSGYKEWFRDVSYITSVIKIQSAGVESFMLFKYISLAASRLASFSLSEALRLQFAFWKKAAGALSKSKNAIFANYLTSIA